MAEENLKKGKEDRAEIGEREKLKKRKEKYTYDMIQQGTHQLVTNMSMRHNKHNVFA
jgi:hypothetical protein